MLLFATGEMRKAYLLSLIVLFTKASFIGGFNIETSITTPLNLRNGGSSDVENGTAAAYAGYSFTIQKQGGNFSILVGQPHSGIQDGNNVTSAGAIYSCEFGYEGLQTTNSMPVISTTDYATTTYASGVIESTSPGNATTIYATNMPSTPTPVPDFSTPACQKVDITNGNEERGKAHSLSTDSLGLSIHHIDNGAPANPYVVCSSQRSRECPHSNITYVPGACYTGNHADSWTISEWKEEGCFSQDLEIIFVVDGSGSITPSQFAVVRESLVSVTTSLQNQFGEYIRMEVLQYSNKDPPFLNVKLKDSRLFRIPFRLGDCETVQCYTNGINNMQHLRQQTFTYYGLRRAIEVGL